MNDPFAEIDAAIQAAEQLRRILRRSSSRQVSSVDDRAMLKGSSLAWFRKHRPAILACVQEAELSELDQLNQRVLEASERRGLRTKYLENLGGIKRELVALRSRIAVSPAGAEVPSRTHDQPPDFSPLVADPRMQEILRRRWTETGVCTDAGAPLAAIVMMGGLLEALILARITRLTGSSKDRVFKARSAPKDRKTGKALPLQRWTLHSYVDVAHELGWISQSARDVGVVLRDYRNYIHPQKELSHGITIKLDDTKVLWEVFKSIATQLIARV